MKKNKLSQRITWRVIGIMVFFNVLIIAAIHLFVYDVSFLLGSSRSQYVIDGIGGKMETMLRAVTVAANNNRAAIEGNIDSPEQVFDALEQVLSVNGSYVGCFAAFEPNYFKSQGRWFEAYVYHTDSTFLGRRQVGSASHDYFNAVWYKKALNLDRDDIGYLTDPYFDNSVVPAMYCSFVVPIFDRQNRKVGVFGIDLNVSWIDTTIQQAMENVKKEFLADKALTDSDGNPLFSIQVLDSKGRRIAGSDSLNLKMLDNERKQVEDDNEMTGLKGTPYFIHTRRIEGTGATVVVLQHYKLVFTWGLYLAIVIAVCMLIGGIVIFFFIKRSIRRATKPLGQLSNSAYQVAKGNFDTELPIFKYNDEVAQLRDSFGTMQESLKQYVEELKESTAAKVSIESELNIAHNIQMSMIPKTFPAFPDRKDIDLYASLVPAKAVGGDLYDFFIRDEKLFFCIGDVSGKGVPASLVMAVSRTLFRNAAAHSIEPSYIVETMNNNISDGNENCMFVTLFVGVLDLQTGHLRYCNAGHNAPFIIRENNERKKEVLPFSVNPNFPVGLMPDYSFTEQEYQMTPGTMLFLYTDGLKEAENAMRDQFNEERTAGVIASFTGTPQQLVETMTKAVHQFVGDTEQSDDLTMLAIKYKE